MDKRYDSLPAWVVETPLRELAALAEEMLVVHEELENCGPEHWRPEFERLTAHLAKSGVDTASK